MLYTENKSYERSKRCRDPNAHRPGPRKKKKEPPSFPLSLGSCPFSQWDPVRRHRLLFEKRWVRGGTIHPQGFVFLEGLFCKTGPFELKKWRIEHQAIILPSKHSSWHDTHGRKSRKRRQVSLEGVTWCDVRSPGIE